MAKRVQELMQMLSKKVKKKNIQFCLFGSNFFHLQFSLVFQLVFCLFYQKLGQKINLIHPIVNRGQTKSAVSFNIFSKHVVLKVCLNELKFCKVSRNPKSNSCWKFQLSILTNKIFLFLKRIWSVPCTMDSSFFSHQMR